MIDFRQKMLDDLPQQFREKERIQGLYETIAEQFQSLFQFYTELMENRFLSNAVGSQLDRIGEILVLTRSEAQTLMKLTDRPTDEEYRLALIYKTNLIFGNGTYSDVMRCLKLINGGTLGFRYYESQDNPATFMLETLDAPNTENVEKVLKTPIPRAAGVGLHIRANVYEETGVGSGFLSHVAESRETTMDTNTFDDFVCLTDIDENVYLDENNNIITE